MDKHKPMNDAFDQLLEELGGKAAYYVGCYVQSTITLAAMPAGLQDVCRIALTKISENTKQELECVVGGEAATLIFAIMDETLSKTTN